MYVEEGAGSYVVGEETALLASLQGFRGTVSARPPFPAERGWHGKPTVVHNVETLCNVPFIALHGSEAYAALSPGATPGTKLVCLNERFQRPGMYEVRFGTPMAEICEELGGGLVDGHEIKAVQIGGPLGGILPGSKLDTPFDFDELAAEGCMVGHGGIARLRRPHRHARAGRATCSSSAPTRAAASASRAGSGSSARSRWSDRPAAWTARGSRRCSRRSSSARSAPTAAACRRRSAA